jgi:hypothetical protein
MVIYSNNKIIRSITDCSKMKNYIIFELSNYNFCTLAMATAYDIIHLLKDQGYHDISIKLDDCFSYINYNHPPNPDSEYNGVGKFLKVLRDDPKVFLCHHKNEVVYSTMVGTSVVRFDYMNGSCSYVNDGDILRNLKILYEETIINVNELRCYVPEGS